MPWEISIIKGSAGRPEPLGSREAVTQAFANALPGVEFAQPPLPPTEFLDSMSPDVREAFTRPRLEAVFEDQDLFIQFYASDESVIRTIHAEVRGDGDPIPVLACLCLAPGWQVVSDADGQPVDLSAEDGSPAWKQFTEWRTTAIKQIAEGDSAGE